MTPIESIHHNGCMPDQVIIEGLEFQGHCGVTAEERSHRQPIRVDLELTYPGPAPTSDDLAEAVDYTTVVRLVEEIGTSGTWALLETLADQICTKLLAEFPVSTLRLWVRKVGDPVPGIRGSVGVRLERTGRGHPKADAEDVPLPAQFLEEQFTRLPQAEGTSVPLALDVAAGRGRHALYLAARGFAVEAIDRDEHALAQLAASAQRRTLSNLTVQTVDLEAHPTLPPDLPKERYDLILVFFYLHRPLFPVLLQALKPGGVLIYETFLIDNHLRHQHPRRKEFCLAHNELLELTASLRVLHYDEGEHQNGPGHGSHPGSSFTARLLAKKERPHA